MPQRHTIVLVHGTNATSDAWSRTVAMVERRLESASTDLVQYHTFSWSGANSHSARLRAADDLAGWLHENTPKEGRSVTLIGHSHGGNVCLYATNRPEIGPRIARIVTLGTPFITVRKRDVGRGWNDLLVTLTLYVLSAVFYGAIAIDWKGVSSLTIGIVYLVLFAMIVAGFRFAFWLATDADSLLNTVRTKQDSEFDQLAHRAKSIPVHAFRVRLDEAAVLLRSLRFLSERPAAVFSMLLAIRQSFLSCGETQMQRGIAAAFFLAPQQLLHVLLSAIVYVPLGVTFLALVLVPKVVRGHAKGFGERGLMQNVLLDIGSSSSPPTGWPASIEEVRARESFLRHSTFLTDPKIVDLIASLHVEGFSMPTRVALDATHTNVSAKLGHATGIVLFWLVYLLPLWILLLGLFVAL